MKTTLASLFSAVVLLFSTGAAFAQQSAQWTTDYSKALAQAKAENKVVLLDFTGSDWCGWCMKMKADTLDQPQFKHYAAKNLVLVELDFPRQKTLPEPLKQQNQQLAVQFQVRGYPCFVLVDATGKELGRQGGYLEGGPAAFIAKLNNFHKPATANGGNGSGWTTSGSWGSSWSTGSGSK